MSIRMIADEMRLLSRAAQISGVDAKMTESCASSLLGIPLDETSVYSGHSTLNSNGSPLELCITSGASGLSARVLADPAFFVSGALEQYRIGQKMLIQALDASGCTAMHRICGDTLEFLVGNDPDRIMEFQNGILWLGSGVLDKGIALYIDADPAGKDDSWVRTGNWLISILKNPEYAISTLDTLSKNVKLASIGIEGSVPANARAKIHWRLRRSIPIKHLGIDLLMDNGLLSFLVNAVGERSIHRNGIVMSAGFSITTGVIADVKIDICGHCLNMATNEWVNLIHWCANNFDIREIPIQEVLQDTDMRVAYIGLGLNSSGSYRLNLYLRVER